MCTEKMHVKVKSVSSIARPIIKLIQYILPRKVQLNSWQALIKPWNGFCGPLEVRTHPLPPPDSGASFSSASFSKLPPLRGTNLATGNQQKHLFLSFPTNS